MKLPKSERLLTAKQKVNELQIMMRKPPSVVPKSFAGAIHQMLDRVMGENLGIILAKNTGWALFIKISSHGLMLAVQILLARVMGVDQFGVYVYVLTWLNVLVMIAKLGTDTTMIRYLPAYEAHEDWSCFRGIMRWSHLIVLTSSVLLGTSIILGCLTLSDVFLPALLRTFLVGAFVLPFLAFNGLHRAILRALKQVVPSQLPEDIFRPVLMLLLVGFIAGVLRVKLKGSETMTLYLLTSIMTFLLYSYWLKRNLPQQANSSRMRINKPEWIAVTAPLFFISLTYMGLGQIDTILVGAILNPSMAGIYAAASRLAKFTMLGVVAVSVYTGPKIAELFARNKKEDLQKLIGMANLLSFAFALIIALSLILFGRFLLLLFGQEFAMGYNVLLILAISQLLASFAGTVGFMMSLTGHQNVLLMILSIALLFNLVANWYLILRLDIVGAAVATALVNIAWNLSAAWYVYRRMGINCFKLHLPQRSLLSNARSYHE